MKRNRLTIIKWLVALLPFPVLYAFTYFLLSDIYLFEWMADNWYCGLWVIVIIVCFFSTRFATVLSYSNVISILLGQILGDVIRKHNISKITADTGADYEAHLRIHYGVPIWLILLFSTAIVYAIIILIRKKRVPN